MEALVFFLYNFSNPLCDCPFVSVNYHENESRIARGNWNISNLKVFLEEKVNVLNQKFYIELHNFLLIRSAFGNVPCCDHARMVSPASTTSSKSLLPVARTSAFRVLATSSSPATLVGFSVVSVFSGLYTVPAATAF